MTDKDQDTKKLWVEAEKYIQLGLAIPACTLIGWLLGGVLQRWLHQEWLPLAGLIVGTVAAFANFVRVAMSEAKQQ